MHLKPRNPRRDRLVNEPLAVYSYFQIGETVHTYLYNMNTVNTITSTPVVVIVNAYHNLIKLANAT